MCGTSCRVWALETYWNKCISRLFTQYLEEYILYTNHNLHWESYVFYSWSDCFRNFWSILTHLYPLQSLGEVLEDVNEKKKSPLIGSGLLFVSDDLISHLYLFQSYFFPFPITKYHLNKEKNKQTTLPLIASYLFSWKRPCRAAHSTLLVLYLMLLCNISVGELAPTSEFANTSEWQLYSPVTAASQIIT